jgi:predicted esterase
MDGLHQGQPVIKFGLPVKEARAAMVLIHGRGASPEAILSLVPEFDQSGFTYLAPQAAGFTWYPYSFLRPLAENEPGLASALAVIETLLSDLADAGIPAERTILLGFSQGACLAIEFAARHAQRFGGVVGLSGGLIGPVGTPRVYVDSLDSTPVFLGCSDVDPHIPKDRVLESAQVLQELGGKVTLRIYPQMGHLVNEDEIEAVREQMRSLLAGI